MSLGLLVAVFVAGVLAGAAVLFLAAVIHGLPREDPYQVGDRQQGRPQVGLRDDR